MNRILFDAEEIREDGTVKLSGVRAGHVLKVLHAEVGSKLRTGTVNGLAGTSLVEAVADGSVTLRPDHQTAAPNHWIDLILAMPRPKTLKRLWPQLAALGVGRVVLINGRRVEKCYFDSHWLEPLYYRPLLLEGLMQAGLTMMPEVLERRRFKPFIEDELDALFPGTCRLAAHPGIRTAAFGNCVSGRPLLAVGPEGGWSAFELKLLVQHGFQHFSLGERTLRTDTACVALIAVLESLVHAEA
ncbi:MAG: RsmE family RNA methyltransferase [Kiritimatiellae bacterium]|nr:RsmE family RNA methyltransferase [Kiritimatiellia bacterium]